MNLSKASLRIIPITVAIAFFLNSLDAFILNVAIPTIATALNQPPLILKLAVTTYLLSMGVFIPVSGWLADRFGTRTIFLWATIIFGVGSLTCGLAHNLFELVASRFLQGIGGALMLPVGRLLLTRVYPKDSIMQLMAMVAMLSLMGPALGPILGGVIITYFSWSWIFFVNLPFAVMGVVLILKFVPNIKQDNVRALDWIGFISFGLGVAGLGFGFAAMGQQVLSAFIEIACVVAGLFFLAVYVVHHRRARHPFINADIFKIATFRVAMIGGFILRMGSNAFSFLVSLMCQLVFDWSPMQTALILLPYPLGLIFSKPFMNKLVQRFNMRGILGYNACFIAFLLLMFACLNPAHELVLLIVLLFVFGMAISLQYSVLQTLNIVNGTPQLLGQMISFSSAMQQIIASFSVAFAAICLEVCFYFFKQQFTLQAFHITFFIDGFIILLSCFSFFKLKPSDGADYVHH